MKILMTHELFVPDIRGGGEKVVYEIAKRLQKKGFEIKIVTTGNPKIKEYDGIPTIRLPINRYFMNLAVPWITKYIKNVDVIQTNNYNACYPSYVAAKISKKPIVCLVHGMYGNSWLKIRGPILGAISREVEKFQICHDYDKIIFFSDFARNTALEVGVKEELTEIIKPGVEFNKYKMGRKEPYILFVGRLAKQKGLESLLGVAKELPSIEFKIVGRGEQEKKLKSMASKNVEFLGFIPENELIDLYSKALVFCLPSIAETFGFVLLEAMASGCAIVSTIPLDYNGRNVKVDNIADLKKGILCLINNSDTAKRMGKMNRKIAKTYSWDKFVKRLIEIYEEVTD